MQYQFTDNQLQVQMLMHIVYMPMVALKVGKYPLNKIISQYLLVGQLSNEEQKHIKDGIQALVDLGIFAQIDNDICITNISEELLKIFDNFSLGTVEQVNQELKSSPKVQALFDAIEHDARLIPYSKSTLITKITSDSRSQKMESKPTSLGSTFGFVLLIIFILFIVSTIN